VRDHYRKLGFTRDAGGNDRTRWCLELAGFKAPALPFAVKHRPRVIEGGAKQAGAAR
jgi:hypothetical protein